MNIVKDKGKEKLYSYLRTWRKNNPSKVRGYSQRWKSKNKDKVASAQKRYALSHPDVIARNRKNWRDKNPNKIREYMRVRRKSPKYRFSKYRSGAIKRGYSFKITYDDFLDILYSGKPTCNYCGTPDNLGIDRVDNQQGYTKDNIVAACWPCNRLKGKMSQDIYIKLCISVAKNNVTIF